MENTHRNIQLANSCCRTGEALDTKTPLLRSEEVVNREAVRLLHVLGHKDVESVKSTLGPEQEFFLIDRGTYKHVIFLRAEKS
jgi:glutamine synthetase